MIGPAPALRIASTVRSTTPPTSPRQPAWATPTTASDSSATGAQSAVRITRAAPGTEVTAASAGSPACSPAVVTVTTSAPCTWRNQVQGRDGTPWPGCSGPSGSAKSPSARVANQWRGVSAT